MAKIKIFKKDGSPTPYYYWSSESGEKPTSVTVFKQRPDGVARMRGVRFNTVTNKMKRV